ncbi:hypothetical protein LTR56_005693 [Elasticomyces elasticus]|nr:hypothetical protein LTR56_005693 [Elasticomyces elasticus]KAK3663920.1 hypothetical protein LTR22_005140 [Elasticomyces elasticus]KAK4927434.1 hypothetical protein LTR49_005839 [Elasticomyces elasticus]KAK5743743.1 hypothetical protein LTS12_023735 [Elasticomyces elasticus]
MGSFFFIIGLYIVPETLAPVLLQRKAARLRQETKNWALHSKLDEEPVKFGLLMRKYGLRPIQMITHEPILIVMTIYISLVYGILYLIFFAFPISYEYDRHWDFGISSLPFIGIFLGCIIACCIMSWETLHVFMPKMNKAKTVIPEERLPPMMAGSIILVIGLFWFAWTSFPSINPWPQIISGVFIGCGIIMVFMPAVIYLVDVYLFEANSALAANAFVRSIVAAAFPLFSTYMYESLGVQSSVNGRRHDPALGGAEVMEGHPGRTSLTEYTITLIVDVPQQQRGPKSRSRDASANKGPSIDILRPSQADKLYAKISDN